MDKVMDIVKLKEFSLLKKEVKESEQNKNLDNDNRRLEIIAEVLKDPKGVCETTIDLYFFIES